jgi:hypothetical protein
LCDEDILFFNEPCDEMHIRTECDTRNDNISRIYCVRSGSQIGLYYEEFHSNDQMFQHIYMLNDLDMIRFFNIQQPWPVPSQPENCWGSEGQYRAWNNNELSQKGPLSY